MDPIRCALVGLGMIGTEHASILHALPDGELAVVVDTDESRAEHVPDGVPFTTDLAEALATPGLDAVYVCTPQHLHRPIVEAGLDRGLAVFSEKPFAASIDDADAMMAAAAKASSPLVIGHTLRFHPDYIAVHRAVAAGEVGQPVQLAARWNAPDYEGRIISGRTTVPLEMCIHDLDIMRWLAGDIEAVYAEASSIPVTGPGPDAIAGTVRFASGAVGALDHSWIMASATGFSSDHRLAVFGTEGSAFVESRDNPAVVFGNAGPRFVNSSYRTDANGIPFGALAAEDSFFLAMVRDGRAPTSCTSASTSSPAPSTPSPAPVSASPSTKASSTTTACPERLSTQRTLVSRSTGPASGRVDRDSGLYAAGITSPTAGACPGALGRGPRRQPRRVGCRPAGAGRRR